MRFELNNREASADELAYLKSLGQVAVSTGLRSMARLPDGSQQALVEVKAVDGAYPLYGTVTTDPQSRSIRCSPSKMTIMARSQRPFSSNASA